MKLRPVVKEDPNVRVRRVWDKRTKRVVYKYYGEKNNYNYYRYF